MRPSKQMPELKALDAFRLKPQDHDGKEGWWKATVVEVEPHVAHIQLDYAGEEPWRHLPNLHLIQEPQRGLIQKGGPQDYRVIFPVLSDIQREAFHQLQPNLLAMLNPGDKIRVRNLVQPEGSNTWFARDFHVGDVGPSTEVVWGGWAYSFSKAVLDKADAVKPEDIRQSDEDDGQGGDDGEGTSGTQQPKAKPQPQDLRLWFHGKVPCYNNELPGNAGTDEPDVRTAQFLSGWVSLPTDPARFHHSLAPLENPGQLVFIPRMHRDKTSYLGEQGWIAHSIRPFNTQEALKLDFLPYVVPSSKNLHPRSYILTKPTTHGRILMAMQSMIAKHSADEVTERLTRGWRPVPVQFAIKLPSQSIGSQGEISLLVPSAMPSSVKDHFKESSAITLRAGELGTAGPALKGHCLATDDKATGDLEVTLAVENHKELAALIKELPLNGFYLKEPTEWLFAGFAQPHSSSNVEYLRFYAGAMLKLLEGKGKPNEVARVVMGLSTAHTQLRQTDNLPPRRPLRGTVLPLFLSEGVWDPDNDDGGSLMSVHRSSSSSSSSSSSIGSAVESESAEPISSPKSVSAELSSHVEYLSLRQSGPDGVPPICPPASHPYQQSTQPEPMSQEPMQSEPLQQPASTDTPTATASAPVPGENAMEISAADDLPQQSTKVQKPKAQPLKGWPTPTDEQVSLMRSCARCGDDPANYLLYTSAAPGTGKTRCACQCILNILAQSPCETVAFAAKTNYAVDGGFQALWEALEVLRKLDPEVAKNIRPLRICSRTYAASMDASSWPANAPLPLHIMFLQMQERAKGRDIDDFAADCMSVLGYPDAPMDAERTSLARSFHLQCEEIRKKRTAMGRVRSAVDDKKKKANRKARLNWSVKVCEMAEAINELEDCLCQTLVKMIRPSVVFSSLNFAKRRLLTDLNISPTILFIEEGSICNRDFGLWALFQMGEHCKSVVVLGDRRQLQPYTRATGQLRILLTTSILAALEDYRPQNCSIPSHPLTITYRCTPCMMKLYGKYYKEHLSSKAGYESSAPIADHFPFPSKECRVLALHVEGSETHPSSYVNAEEVSRAATVLQALHQAGAVHNKVLLSTQYRGQLARLQDMAQEKVQEWNAQGCQDESSPQAMTVSAQIGREADWVIASLVRSHQQGQLANVGFTREPGRNAVMLSRAKHGLILILNIHTYMQALKAAAENSISEKGKRDAGCLFDILASLIRGGQVLDKWEGIFPAIAANPSLLSYDTQGRLDLTPLASTGVVRLSTSAIPELQGQSRRRSQSIRSKRSHHDSSSQRESSHRGYRGREPSHSSSRSRHEPSHSRARLKSSRARLESSRARHEPSRSRHEPSRARHEPSRSRHEPSRAPSGQGGQGPRGRDDHHRGRPTHQPPPSKRQRFASQSSHGPHSHLSASPRGQSQVGRGWQAQVLPPWQDQSRNEQWRGGGGGAVQQVGSVPLALNSSQPAPDFSFAPPPPLPNFNFRPPAPSQDRAAPYPTPYPTGPGGSWRPPPSTQAQRSLAYPSPTPYLYEMECGPGGPPIQQVQQPVAGPTPIGYQQLIPPESGMEWDPAGAGRSSYDGRGQQHCPSQALQDRDYRRTPYHH